MIQAIMFWQTAVTLWMRLCMNGAITSSANVKPRLCIYLWILGARAREESSYPGAIFGSCHSEGRFGKQGLKGSRGVTLKRSGCSGLPVKPGNISAVETNCVIYSTSAIARPRIRDFSPFWRNKATKTWLYTLSACKISWRYDSMTSLNGIRRIANVHQIQRQDDS